MVWMCDWKADTLHVIERTFECMKQAYDCGINFFDTAERSDVPAIWQKPMTWAEAERHYSYAGGQSEIVMGKAIKKYQWKRNDIVISTKVFGYTGSR